MKALHAGIQKLKQSREVNERFMTWWEEAEKFKNEGRLEFGLSVSEILVRLQEKLSISSIKAMEYFRMYGSKQA